VIVDIAAGKGPSGTDGNCPLTEAGRTVQKHGVFIIGETNIPTLVAADSSSLYARNVFDFLMLIVPPAAKDEPSATLKLDLDDDIVAACLMTHGGEVKRR
jgi:NAD(P) transhydrogenase subunit alpha